VSVWYHLGGNLHPNGKAIGQILRVNIFPGLKAGDFQGD
jgi:hypothetical protein